MSTKTKSPSDAGTSRGEGARRNQLGTASSRRVNFTTGRGVLRGQLTFLFDDALPSPESIVRHGNQRADIVAWFLDGKSITQDEARYLYGVMRLASRISELRASGWNIHREMIAPVEGMAKIARYRLDLSRPFTAPSEGGNSQ